MKKLVIIFSIGFCSCGTSPKSSLTKNQYDSIIISSLRQRDSLQDVFVHEKDSAKGKEILFRIAGLKHYIDSVSMEEAKQYHTP